MAHPGGEAGAVSTHSRLKAAERTGDYQTELDVSTHSRLKAADPFPGYGSLVHPVSTHSRLKAAGCG